MKRVIIIALFALMLTACAADPRREADAYATRQQADTQSEAARQAIQQQAETHDLKMQRYQEVGQWVSALMMTSMIAAMFTVFVALVSFGIGSSFVFIGAGIARAKHELTKPYLVRLDPVTRQYPLLISKVGDGKYSLSNPNTNSTTMLYDRNPADMLMIQAMSAIQHDGALAYQARMSHKPEAIAEIESPRLQILEVGQ
jgi:hypothetical protein